MIKGKLNGATLLESVHTVQDWMHQAESGSLIEYTSPTRIEPILLMDMRTAQLPYVEELIGGALNLFSAYYLQAVSLNTLKIGDVKVMRTLSALNPTRNSRGSGIFENSELEVNVSWESSLESVNVNTLPFYSQEDDEEVNVTLSQSVKDINESANLSLGKLLNVEIQVDSNKATIPVQVRMRTNTIRPQVLSHTLSLGSKKTNIMDRYHKWRSGQLKFVKDIVLCHDLIEAHRNNLKIDESGYYNTISSKKRKNSLISIITDNPSLATASSVIIMNSDTARELETKMRGKLSRFRDREKLFKDTLAMLIFVVDPEWDQITIYHRSIEQPTEVSVREIQRSNKKGGPDITQIMSALLDKKSPTI